MRYYNAILSLIILNILTVLFLLYMGNVSRKIEKQNYNLEKTINFFNNQININEIEFSLYHNYNYLKKLQKIYFDNEKLEIFSNQRLSYNDILRKNIKNIGTVGMQ